MKKGLRIALISVAGLVLAAILAVAGFMLWIDSNKPAIFHDNFTPYPSRPGRTLFNEGWTFALEGETPRTVNLPHDWGVEGEFRQEHPGETGKLPWWGKATYRKDLEISKEDLEKEYSIEIDGAMSHASVSVNGTPVGAWPYGYASFAVPLSGALKEGRNEIVISLDNPKESSRWYPGGGLYRNVWIVRSEKQGVRHWGTAMTTRILSRKDLFADAEASLSLELENNGEEVPATVRTVIVEESETLNKEAVIIAEKDTVLRLPAGETSLVQEFMLNNIRLWDDRLPALYMAITTVTPESGTPSVYYTPFGVREAEFRADGFYLNGQKVFLRGVCLHHDAGALGAAWNTSAWVRRLEKLREMGCNAIRTSHNPPAPELLDLCDKMGFLVIDELTDTWTVPKKENGYAALFDQWAEKDLVAMIRRDRNHPCVIAWSIGNECGEQGLPDRWDIPRRLSEICHREDPTRQTTAGNDNLWAASQPYAETIDVYGFNYKPHAYESFRDTHPGKPFYGSETASCISTRGYYVFPVIDEKNKGWLDDGPFQVSSYDLYAPSWASKPDYEWTFEDKVPECAGEFVWTGFDYLGEPTPYNLDPSILTNFHTEEEKEAAKARFAGWGQKVSDVPLPSRSSYFGIFDLAGFPKDRFWLYMARWAHIRPFIHILPHWTWPGREGEVTPVHVYTNLPSVELFVNGKSQGVRTKGPGDYRLRWDDVVYEPGTLTAKATVYGDEFVQEVRTAGAPARAEVLFETTVGYDQGSKRLLIETQNPDERVIFAFVRILDKKGTLVPTADNKLTFSVSGPAEIIATDNGDPTSHIPFKSLENRAFNGLCGVLLRPTGEGKITLRVRGDGIKGSRASVKIHQSL